MEPPIISAGPGAVGGGDLIAFRDQRLWRRPGRGRPGVGDLLPEAYQPLSAADLPHRGSLIYRTDLPYVKDFSEIRYPKELNRRPGWLAAVGPYVSAVCGHPGFIENAAFISAVQAVAAAAQLRAIHLGVRVLQRHPVPVRGVHQGRRQLADRGAVRDHGHQVSGEPAVHRGAEPGLGLSQPLLPVQEQLLVAGEPVLVTGENARQRQIRRCRAQPRRVGRGVRLDVRHPPPGKRRHQAGATHESLGLILGAAVTGPEPVIRRDDLRGHQPVEQAADTLANRPGRYHQPAPQTGRQTRRPSPARGSQHPRNGSASRRLQRRLHVRLLAAAAGRWSGETQTASPSSAGPYPFSLTAGCPAHVTDAGVPARPPDAAGGHGPAELSHTSMQARRQRASQPAGEDPDSVLTNSVLTAGGRGG